MLTTGRNTNASEEFSLSHFEVQLKTKKGEAPLEYSHNDKRVPGAFLAAKRYDREAGQ